MLVTAFFHNVFKRLLGCLKSELCGKKIINGQI